MPVSLGTDRLLASGRLDGRRVGIVCNPASVDSELRHVADRLAAASARGSTRLTAIFGPQHGFRSDVQENMIETGHARDALRRVPVYSLYSETREPTADMLRDVDLLVVDLQDVGTRIYTYIYTMANCLKAARKHGIDIVVCDRPNPIGGDAVEGPMLVHGFESFVGLYPLPMRHGMTIGEIARLVNETFGIGATLEVVPMEGWSRGMYFDATGIPFVLPSPNIPTLDSAIVYPGTVLFEGTNVSEGRGTTKPFELLGAPWVDAERFADGLNRARAAGRAFPSGGHRADVSQARAYQLRRLSDSRDRPRAVPPGRDRGGPHRRVSRRRSRALRLARSARTSTSTRCCRSTSSPGRPRCESRLKAACRCARSRSRGNRPSPSSSRCEIASCSLDHTERDGRNRRDRKERREDVFSAISACSAVP